YKLTQFEDAFERYLAPEGGFQPRDREDTDRSIAYDQKQPRGTETASRLENARNPDATGTLAVSRSESGGEPPALHAEPELPLAPGQRCDHCGGQFGDKNPWNWPPDCPTRLTGLHPRCEDPWWDCGGQTADDDPTSSMICSRAPTYHKDNSSAPS